MDPTRIKVDGKRKTHPYYEYWNSMMKRCKEGGRYQEKRPTYIGCQVCEEWVSYDNFFEWCEENYYEIEGHRMCLDKDILVKGNKIYSPYTCIFAPNNINVLFIKCNRSRGNLPIGVTYNKRDKKYQSRLRLNSLSKSLGYFSSPEEAFQAYKVAKEQHIKDVADKYKDLIPTKLYNALYNYKVEITD